MPWPPGFVPVANVDQATGVWAGRVVATRRKPPLLPQPRQVRQLARLEQPRDDPGLQPIQADDDDLLDDSNLPVLSMNTQSVRERQLAPDTK